MKSENFDLIVESLHAKAGTKQYIYRKTLEVFNRLKFITEDYSVQLKQKMQELDEHIEVEYSEQGRYECQLRFSGDTLFFIMHSNIFTFPPESFVHNSDYVRKDASRACCGMIMVYNFLSDSIKYHRLHDSGYLLARIFINKEGHFFVQGQRQFSFLFNNFENDVIDEAALLKVLETAIAYAIDFDLFVPPYDLAKEISLAQKIVERGNSAIKTGKRLGFAFREDDNSGETPLKDLF